MKLLLIIIIFILTNNKTYSQLKEVIKIEVDSDCKECLRKRQYKDDLYTKPKSIIKGLDYKASFSFNYIGGKEMFHFTFNEGMSNKFDHSEIYFTIDSLDFVFNKETYESKSVEGISKTITYYIYGYLINQKFIDSLLNSKSISISMINKNSHIRKTWKLNNSSIEDLKKMYYCYKKYSKQLIEEEHHYRSIQLNTKLFKSGNGIINIIDSNSMKINKLLLESNDQIYITGVKKNIDPNIALEKISIEFIYDSKIYYYPIQNLKDFEFNFSNKDIIDFFDNISVKENEVYRLFSKDLNSNFYKNKRELQKQEIEKQKKINEEKTKLENLELLRIKNIQLEKKKKVVTNCINDSLASVNENLKLLKSKENLNTVISKIESIILKGKVNDIILNNFEVIEGEYGNIDLNFSIYNCSNKKIKYISFNIKAFNPVGDQVGSIETVKGIGFINPLNLGEWAFENVWISDIIETVKILSISITFEDGSIKKINDVSSIRYDITSSILNDFNFSKEMYNTYEIIGSIEFDKELEIVSFEHLKLDNDSNNEIELKGYIIIDDVFKNDLKSIINLSKTFHNDYKLGCFKIFEGCDNIYLTDLKNGTTTILSINNAIKLFDKIK